MNQTHIEHLLVALILQAIPGAFFGDWITGGVFAVGIFLGREHAQREYKIGDPSKLVGYEALDFWRWSRDAQIDLLLPVAGVIGLAMLASYLG